MYVVKLCIEVALFFQLLSACYCIIPLDYCRNLTTFRDALNVSIPSMVFKRSTSLDKAPLTPSERGQTSVEVYDFVVIGSGSAGSVIASRLTENPKWRVLLLEVGEVPSSSTDIPAIATSFQMTDYNWGYVNERQREAGLGLVDGIMNLPRGKVLGGTSTINSMVHARGNRLDYDRWAAAGNPGWSFDDVLPYFKKSEDFLVKIQDPEYHARGGPLGVQDVPYRSDSAQAFVNAMLDSRYNYIDYNGRSQIGVSFAHGTLRNGRRSSGYTAYLKPFMNRPNLKVYTGALATKILINKLTKKAYGVRYDRNRETFLVKVKKEVVVSAGAFASPQLLMLSGVGPKEHLASHNIEVVKDLPVGKNLADHVALYGITFTLNESITIPFNEINTNPQHMQDFLQGKGILTTLTGAEAFGFVKTPYTTDPDPRVPDVALIYVGTSNNMDNGTLFRELARVKDDVYNAIWGVIANQTAGTIVPMLYHPRSRGCVELRTNNPYDFPKIYGNYFTDYANDDVKVLISAVRMIQDLLTKSAFRQYGAQLAETALPNCARYTIDTDEHWECVIRHLGVSANHQVGTCRMGPSRDPRAVVGADLTVHGIRRLRVADTSIIPQPVSAHTSIPAFMVGEKAAAMIKATWKNL